MVQLPGNILELIGADKELLDRPSWEMDSDPRYFEMLAPLAVAGITVGALEVRVRASKQLINRDATMQLEYAQSARKRVRLWRCQWRPFETHTNENWVIIPLTQVLVRTLGNELSTGC